MPQVFISYNQSALDLVKTLAQDLEAAGNQVWFDQHLTGGQVWWDNILLNIRQSDIFAFAITPESLKSQACKRELQYAQQIGKTILPVLIVDGVNVSSLPRSLGERQLIDYRQQDKKAAFSLIQALNVLPTPADLPEPLPEPPPVPISYLSGLKEKIESVANLTKEEQIMLVFELKEHILKDEEPLEARNLLLQLKKRDELLARVGEEIDSVLASPQKTPVENIPTIAEGVPVNLSDSKDSDENKFDENVVDENLFPLYGVYLGMTTVKDLDRLGYRTTSKKNSYTGKVYQQAEVHEAVFRLDDNLIVESMYLNSYDDETFPPKWKKLGLKWEFSYNQWVKALTRLGCSLTIVETPKVERVDGKYRFTAEIRATKQELIPIEISLSFNCDQDTAVDAQGTLLLLRVEKEDVSQIDVEPVATIKNPKEETNVQPEVEPWDYSLWGSPRDWVLVVIFSIIMYLLVINFTP